MYKLEGRFQHPMLIRAAIVLVLSIPFLESLFNFLVNGYMLVVFKSTLATLILLLSPVLIYLFIISIMKIRSRKQII